MGDSWLHFSPLEKEPDTTEGLCASTGMDSVSLSPYNDL